MMTQETGGMQGYMPALLNFAQANPENRQVQEMVMGLLMEQLVPQQRGLGGSDQVDLALAVLGSGDPQLTGGARDILSGHLGMDSGYGSVDPYYDYRQREIEAMKQQPGLGDEELERLSYEQSIPDYLHAEFRRKPTYGERKDYMRGQADEGNWLSKIGSVATDAAPYVAPLAAPAAGSMALLPYLTKGFDVRKSRMSGYGY